MVQRERETEDKEDLNVQIRMQEKESSWNGWRKTNQKRKRHRGEVEVEGKSKLMSVLFIQHTPRSELAKRIREKLANLEKVGNLKFKVVEKTGRKIEEILHKSDSWSDRDCGRIDCLLCNSAGEGERRGMCKCQNVVYETFCLTCYEKEERGKEEKEIHSITCEQLQRKLTSADDKEKKRKRKTLLLSTDSKEKKKKKGKREFKIKYVGETGRSAYERGAEHISDFWNYDEGSHLLKHFLTCHRDMRMKDVKFGMRVRNTFRSALERQVGEAVAIDMEQKKGLI